jgi:crotonobetaine/carnitine-CoA ligase
MMVANMGLRADDTYYTPLPLFHADAQLFGVYFPLIYGTRGTVYERFSASRYWQQIRECGATATNMLGAMAHILWKQPERPDDGDNTIRTCQVLPMVDVKEDFEKRFNMSIVTAYGQTETNFVTFDTAGKWRPGSCGRTAPGFQVRIVDEFDQPVAPHTTGEIVVRAEHPWWMSSGYYGKPDKTAEANRNQWFHSGDTGYLDEDGWLYFRDRIKDVIRRRGENISTHDIEMVIDAHPLVVESAAVAFPSELSEDDIKVFVVLKAGADLSAAALIRYCEDNMPRQMVPRYVELKTALLPRTPSEKIAREELRALGNGPDTWDREKQPAPDVGQALTAKTGS